MADLSFLEKFYQQRQDNGPVFLADLHREPESWEHGEQQQERGG